MSFAATDAVGYVLHTAINGLSLRQQVTADNIANVDTPGFRARAVEFESALSAAIDRGAVTSGGTGSVQMTVQATETPVGANDNNVDLRNETMAAIQTQYQYQVMSRAISDRDTRMSTMGGAF